MELTDKSAHGYQLLDGEASGKRKDGGNDSINES
jgi:hypothetical protein